MIKLFFPHEYTDSVFSIDYSKLYTIGYRGIIFDIDNTLVPHGADSTEAVDALFREIQQLGFKTLLLSNNGEDRIQSFLRNIDSMYISNADKPKPHNYHRAVDMLGLRKEEVIFLGDQLFTDIFGANLSGIDNILVQYIRKQDETKIGKRRTLEKVILKLYGTCKSCQNRIGDIYKVGGAENAVEKG